ncbi:MAG: Planctomycete cytochrome [Pedosphaera sp.]|nr:Planctomycete cytochrome [Pedosphaera sp.]
MNRCNAKYAFVMILGGMLVAAGVANAAELDPSKLPPASTKKADFERDIKPIIDESCIRCHGPKKQKAKYRMDSREAALKGNKGPVIVPGKSEKSRMVYMLANQIEKMLMPPEGEGDPLTPEQIGMVRAWIDQGAQWPEDKNNVVAQVDFAKEVDPILRTACVECHGAKEPKGGFGVETKEAVLKGGKGYGKVVIAGESKKSPLIAIVSGKDEDIAQPEKHKLPAEQVELLKKWIEQGAK